MSVELADIFRLFGQEYCDRYASSVLPGHRKALSDITRCRTPELGGQLFQCSSCHNPEFSYHSCNNRHCPKCQNDAASAWVLKQQQFLLPVPYFFATFTIPEEMNSLAYARQRLFYRAFFRASSKALLLCAKDPRFLGAQIGFLGVLQTWTRDLRYHPHIHYIVPGGGLAFDNETWVFSKKKDFFVHVKPLSRLFKGKLKHELKEAGLFQQIHSSVWKKDWVVHIQPAGHGQEVIKYLAPYVYRVALSNRKIVSLDGRKVSFKFKESHSKQWKVKSLDALDFIRSFMCHVLPRGLVKIRYYGFLSPNQRRKLDSIKKQLNQSDCYSKNTMEQKTTDFPKPRKCRSCGGSLLFLGLLPKTGVPP